jgi:chaperone LolA
LRARRAAALPAAVLAAFLAAPGAERDAAAAPADALARARRLETALASLKGLVARFTQTVESPGLPRPQVERGTVYLLRPGRMRFEYDEPRGKLAVADGRRFWLYLPDERQVLTAPIDASGADKGIALLMRDFVRIEKEFLIDWGAPPEGRGAAAPLRLTPRARDAEYDHLLVEPGPDGLPITLTAVDPLGGRVSYRFTLARRVDSLDPALFRFVPPAGIEVQEVAR